MTCALAGREARYRREAGFQGSGPQGKLLDRSLFLTSASSSRFVFRVFGEGGLAGPRAVKAGIN